MFNIKVDCVQIKWYFHYISAMVSVHQCTIHLVANITARSHGVWSWYATEVECSAQHRFTANLNVAALYVAWMCLYSVYARSVYASCTDGEDLVHGEERSPYDRLHLRCRMDFADHTLCRYYIHVRLTSLSPSAVSLGETLLQNGVASKAWTRQKSNQLL